MKLLPAIGLVAVLAAPAPADEVVPCAMAGPAGTSSVLRVDLPRGSSSLALRVTSTRPPTDAVGRHGSWHLATQIALLRARDGALVAHRAVQLGSSPRAAVVTLAGVDLRVALPTIPAPFRHVGASVPPYLPRGRYLLVAYGSDGSRALPNPGWSAEASFGVPVTCVALRVPTQLVDHDQSDFTGGTQAGAYAVGSGADARLAWSPRRRYVVGLVDAAVQAAGSAQVVGQLPRGRRVEARDALRPFVGTSGTYRFTADWSGAFPLVLVTALAFDA